MILREWSTFFVSPFSLGQGVFFWTNLTDVLENIKGRVTCVETIMDWTWLDPVDYNALPNFAFDAMFKLTGIEIGLVGDQEMYGMTQITFKKLQTDKNHMGTDCGKN